MDNKEEILRKRKEIREKYYSKADEWYEKKKAKMEKAIRENGGSSVVKTSKVGMYLINGNEKDPEEVMPNAVAFQKELDAKGIDVDELANRLYEEKYGVPTLK